MLKDHINIKKYKIMHNYRTFDENDGFETDELCDYCGKASEQYAVLEGHIYICKGCLDKMITAMNKEFVKHMKNAKRKGIK